MLTFVVIVCTGENEGRTGERTSGTDGSLNHLEYKVTIVHTSLTNLFGAVVYIKVGLSCIADQPNFDGIKNS